MLIRPYRHEDAAGVVHTVKTVFLEYGFGWYPDTYCNDVYTVEETYERSDVDWGVIKVTRTVRIFGIRVATTARLQYLNRR